MNKKLEKLTPIFDYIKRDALSFVLVSVVAIASASIAFRAGVNRGQESAPTTNGSETANGADSKPTVWTCSMHPQIQVPKKGKCPLCGMDLIPLKKSSGDDEPRTLVMSPASMALAEIRTQPVERRFVTHTIQMVGKVHYDETKLAYITANFPGRLDRLFVDYTGVSVNKNDHLVEIYSPDLLTAQQELLEAVRGVPKDTETPKELRRMAQSLVNSAEEKLRLWGLNAEQIAAIKKSSKPQDQLTINAPVGGIVIHKNAVEGMWITTGSRIYTIADLSRVWVFLDAYESDLPWVYYGQEVEFATAAYPQEVFKGRIAFVSPVLNDKTRTVRLRVNVENSKGMLKPEMFIRASIRARIANKGHVIDPSLAGKWISPMHPEIVKDEPGPCPVCGMDLVPAETLGVEAGAGEPPLVVPATAVLVTGRRAVVYVKVPDKEQPTFVGRTVVLGPRAGDHYLVEQGLAEGDLVVVRGNFKIDSALQIQAEPAMMMPDEAFEEKDSVQTYEVEMAFKQSLSPFFSSYLALQKALADDDIEEALKQLKVLPVAVKQVANEALEGEAAQAWIRYSKALGKPLEHADHLSDLKGIRKLNVELSEVFVDVAKAFGLTSDQDVKVAFCPMANGDKGAHWLQPSGEIANPYFGAAMLTCGEFKETLGPAEPKTFQVSAAFRESLQPFSTWYFQLQKHLAGDNVELSREALMSLSGALKSVKGDLVEGAAAARWKDLSDTLSNHLGGASDASDLKSIRKLNVGLSEIWIQAVEAFNITGSSSAYVAHCPMANGSKGASWLQESEDILNPFFGADMLECGEIKRSLGPEEQGPKTDD